MTTALAVVEKIEQVSLQPKSRFMVALAQSMPQGIGLLPAALVRGALSAIKASPSLQKCSEYSLFTSIAEVAQTGLSLDTHLGQAYLVPFSGQATVMYGYRGLIELARRSAEVDEIVGELRYEKDHWAISLGSQRNLTHVPFDGPPSKRGKILGAYAVAELRHGRPMFEYMTAEEIEAIRDPVLKRHKARTDKPSPWETNGTEMFRKTPIRRLAKRMPQSPSLVNFVAAAIRDEYRQQGMSVAPIVSAETEKVLDTMGIEPPTPIEERTSEIHEKPSTNPISANEFDDLYTMMADAKLSMEKDLIPLMKSFGHKGNPKQFPKANLAALIEKIQERKK